MSWIPDSKAQKSGFYKQTLPDSESTISTLQRVTVNSANIRNLLKLPLTFELYWQRFV